MSKKYEDAHKSVKVERDKAREAKQAMREGMASKKGK